MKPGDFIEWVYKSDRSAIAPDELLYSSPMKKWVPISGLALLIGNADGILTWVSDKGLFHASVDDTCGKSVWKAAGQVVPRACG